MKKVIAMILLGLIVPSIFVGCVGHKVEQEAHSQTTAIGNPWSDWDSIEAAEAATGFPFGLPEVITDSYKAVTYRTMNNELIEVIYQDEDFEVRVRKQKGEGQDISGDYNSYDTFTEEKRNGGMVTTNQNTGNQTVKQIISYNGYSWSITASNGFWGDSNADFLNAIFEG